MNESLINPFTLSHPTAVQTSLFAGAIFSRFDPTGRFIAAARLDGSAQIWDLETRGTIRTLDGHVKALTSIDWSHHSRYLLTSSKDWNILIWDLASPTNPPLRYNTLRFDAPVHSACFHPKNSQIVLALLSTGELYLCDTRKSHRTRAEILESILEDGEEEDENSGQGRARSPMTAARFDPSGKNIFVGNAAGYVLVFNTRTRIMVGRHKIIGAGSIKSMDFAKSGRRLVTNSSDRTLRQFSLSTYPTPLNETDAVSILETEWDAALKFSDPINRSAWHAMCYSPDGEWLAGGAADPAAHKIHVWDLANGGRLASALDGGREPLIHLHWHPLKSSMASTTNHGNILIWHCPSPERWGAFAGGFEEVDENVEYEEREDEFDIEDEAVISERKRKAEEEEVDIDTLLTGEQISAFDKRRGTQTPGHTGVSTPIGQPSHGDTALGGIDGGMLDLDAAWAEAEPDGDGPGAWKMKIIMDDSQD
ncbi:hypothetical protein CVT24_013283 [Panaeolus cyanescens]|uniref:Uncharacterized protein n=1 Tax=Panaeolus cyanescens TaxID=181874 RepID=A0A409VW38_9AGAR|nr:hypothetical protein CVT24_013283 [Panaeolus cyanescens]